MISDAPSQPPVAVVSGSASGIGAAAARHFARHGCNVVVNYSRNRDGAEHTVQQCRKRGVEAVCVQADVAKEEDCRRITATAAETWGRLDILVNNAGITRFADARDLDALTARDFQDIFAVNVAGAYSLTRAAAAELKRSPFASVVNVSSHSGFSGSGSSIAYAASKGALNTLTLSLARALAPEVRVNAVCPGFVDTRWMAERLSENELDDFKRRITEIAPLKKLITAEDVAEAISWFALGGATITGQLLVIDGGTHLTVGSPI